MKRVTFLVAVFAVVLAMTAWASAQDGTATTPIAATTAPTTAAPTAVVTAIPTTTETGLFITDARKIYITGLPDLPRGSSVGDIGFFEGFDTRNITLATSCANTRAYKMNSEGILELWPLTCTPDGAVLESAGDAHFVFLNFGSATAAAAAPASIAEGARSARLSGRAEVPGPGDADGSGSASISLDIANGQVCYNLRVSGIESATAAHIHAAPVGVAGPVVVPLGAPSLGTSTGCTDDVDRSLIRDILRNPSAYYVNVHNEAFPGGAVRGQLGR